YVWIVRFATMVGSVVRKGEDNMYKHTRSYRVFALILAVFLTLTVAGCGGSSAASGPKALKIIAVPKSLASSYWTIVEDGIKCYACKVPNVSIVWDGVPTDQQLDGQISLLQNYISQKPDGILYAAIDAKALAPVNQQAVSAGVPIYNFDSGTTPQDIPLF